MWTITDDKGNVATDSGLVVVTTDSDKKLVTATSVFPRPDPGCPECTEYTQTWMITDDKSVVATDSGVVKVTTDSGKNLVTLTSLIPRPSDPGCSECTEFTQTWTFTDDLGVVATDSGVVLVTTDSDRKVVTATSLIPRPSEPGCPDCSEYTTTWTVTAENGQVSTDSGVVVVTTDSENKLTTKTSVIARPSDSGCAECTEFTLTWSFTDSNGVIATDSGLVVVTTGDDKKLTTKTSVIPRPSDQGCSDCTEYTLTWTLTNDQGDVTTASGIVLVTTDSDKSLVTKTSLLPSPSRSGCPDARRRLVLGL